MTAHWQVRVALAGALAVALLQSGCAVLVNRPGEANCDAGAAPAVVDLAIGAMSTAAIVAGGAVEESPGWLAVPGVFFASAMLGAVSVHSCPSEDSSNATLGPSYPPEHPTPPSVRVETDAEPLAAPSSAANGVGLPRLSNDSPLGNPLPDATGKALECGPALPTVCPHGQVCQLVDGALGACVAEPRPTETP